MSGMRDEAEEGLADKRNAAAWN